MCLSIILHKAMSPLGITEYVGVTYPSYQSCGGCVRTLPAVSESCCSSPTPQAMDWVYAAAQQCREDGRGSLHAFLLQQVTLRVSSCNQQKGEGANTMHGGDTIHMWMSFT